MYPALLPVVIIRPPNVLGIGQKELESLLKLVKKRILPQLGNGDEQTSICFTADVVRALILAAERHEATGQTYFVTDNRQYSWPEMIRFIANEMGVLPYVLKIPYPLLYAVAVLFQGSSRILRTPLLVNPMDIKSSRKYYWLYSSKKIESELGYFPQVKFEEEVRNIIFWYNHNTIK